MPIPEQKKQPTLNCGKCFPCEHLKTCPDRSCGPHDSCETCIDALQVGCQNKFCEKHQCRVNSLKCDCTTKFLRQKYSRGSKEVYGWFKCHKTKQQCNRWNSAHAWVEKGSFLSQNCKKCEKPCAPFKARLKEWRGDNKEDVKELPHDEERCQKCRRLGRACWYKV